MARSRGTLASVQRLAYTAIPYHCMPSINSIVDTTVLSAHNGVGVERTRDIFVLKSMNEDF